MKSNSCDGKASLDSVECSGPPTMLSAASALAFQQQVGLADGVGLGVDLLAVQVGKHLPAVLGGELLRHSSATVSMPPVPQAPSYSRYVPVRIGSAMGRNPSFAMSLTAARGVQCSVSAMTTRFLLAHRVLPD